MCAPLSMPDISDGESVSPACAKISVSALGALGLDNGGKSGEAAAAFTVGHHLICNQIDVIDQEERNVRGLRIGRAGAEDDDEQADGETAKGGHGGEAGFQSDAAGSRA